jgi:hypothetical protein
MGLLEAATSERNSGGQPHRLHEILRGLPADEADELREILGRPPEEVNWAALKAAMDKRGFRRAATTWHRYGHDYRTSPERFA